MISRIFGTLANAEDILRDDEEIAMLFGIDRWLRFDENCIDLLLTTDYLAAFVNGAAEVWEEVKDEI